MIVKGAITKKQDRNGVCGATEGNVQKGGTPLLLKEIRCTVVKDQKEHQKLLYNLLVEKDALLISAKGRGAKEPVITSLETLLAPYLGPEEVKTFRRIARLVYIRKQKQVS